VQGTMRHMQSFIGGCVALLRQQHHAVGYFSL